MPRNESKSDSSLDVVDYKLRQIYFLRKAIGTCRELAQAVQLLDKSSDYQSIAARFTLEDSARWKAALGYFRNQEPFWKKIRNDIGGHFGCQAAEFALQNLESNVHGWMEKQSDRAGRVDVLLGFAGEIAATALLRHLTGNGHEEKIKNLLSDVIEAKDHAMTVKSCLVDYHLWDRAG